MKSLTDILLGVAGAAALVIALWQLVAFVTYRGADGHLDMGAGIHHLWWAILAAVITIACVVAYFVRHPRVEEEIHISQ